MFYDKIKLECVYERDIDLILLEEWNVNPRFVRFFIAKELKIKKVIDSAEAWHSVTDEFGEADLVLSFQVGEEKNLILLENKIAATAQENQAARYLLCAQKYLDEGICNQVHIVIAAPERYLRGNAEAQKYPAQISYEIIKSFWKSDNARARYRANMMQLAITQERRGYSAKLDEQVTGFWRDYYWCLQEQIPQAIMKEPVIVPRLADWPDIRYSWFPARWVIRHKFARGCIDLETRLSPEEAEAFIDRINCQNIELAQTGKSISIRIVVPTIDRMGSFAKQREALNVCFDAIKFLGGLDKFLSKAE